MSLYRSSAAGAVALLDVGGVGKKFGAKFNKAVLKKQQTTSYSAKYDKIGIAK